MSDVGPVIGGVGRFKLFFFLEGGIFVVCWLMFFAGLRVQILFS